MDEAFRALPILLPDLLPEIPDLIDVEAGVRSRVTGYELETPVELSIEIGPDGAVEIGGAPPLYHLETSTQPVLHAIRLVAVRGGGY